MKKLLQDWENWWWINGMTTFCTLMVVAILVWSLTLAAPIYILAHFIYKYW